LPLIIIDMVSDSQQSRLAGRTLVSQCGRHCCRSKTPSEGSRLSPRWTAAHRSWSVRSPPSCSNIHMLHK